MAKEENEQKLFRRRRKKPCVFCADKISSDYKNVEFMRRFITDRGKIAPPRISGCCAKHQRIIAKEIKRGRQLGLLPHTID